MDGFTWIILAAFGGPAAMVLGYQWLVLPLRFRAKNTAPLRPRREPASPDALTPETRVYFARLLQQAQAEGFETVANVRLPDAFTDFDTAVLLMADRARGDVLCATAAVTKLVRVLTYEITTDLPDGRRVATTAMREPPAFPPEPGVRSVVCGWTPGVAALYAFHRRRLADAGTGDEAGAVPAVGDGLAWLDAAERRANDWLVRCGYRVADPAAGVWRFTVRGAYLVIWKCLDPVKTWRVRRNARWAEREWKRLGMGAIVSADTDDAPRADEAVAPDAAAGLAYSTEAGPDELRYVPDAAGLTVRVGRTSPRAFGRRYAIRLACVAVLTVSAALPIVAEMRSGWRGVGSPHVYLPPLSLFYALVMLLTAGLMAVGLVGQWRLDRRAVTLRATHAGLGWDGVPGKPRQGEVARHGIAALLLPVGGLDWRGRRYSLVLRRHGRPLPLVLVRHLTRTDGDALHARLRAAMGLTAGADGV